MLAAIFFRLLLAAASAVEFPRDHGAHPEAAVEWWYYTGHLSDRAGKAYGFQLTFFRVRELHLAHFAWTDVARKKFSYEEKTHLALPGIAGAATGRLDVSNEDWSARAGPRGVHEVAASGPAGELRLSLTPVKPPVVHGDAGLSRKGPGAAEYSRYVSITRMNARGTVKRGASTEVLSGTAWFDHEWGPGVLPAAARGWDWFALQLDDGSDVMLYRMRGEDGKATPFSSGTLVPRSGAPSLIRWTDVRLDRDQEVALAAVRRDLSGGMADRRPVDRVGRRGHAPPRRPGARHSRLDRCRLLGGGLLGPRHAPWPADHRPRLRRAHRIQVAGRAGARGVGCATPPEAWASPSARTSTCLSASSPQSGRSNSPPSGCGTRTETAP